MQIRTISVTLSARREVVFNFLADVENFPKWAAEFCERIELRHNGWLAYTSQGEAMVELEADNHTGIIDLRIGPTLGELALYPLRVVPLFEEGALVSFTLIQLPDQPDELYERQYQSWLIEMQGLIRRFEGGELHAPADAFQWGVLGLN